MSGVKRTFQRKTASLGQKNLRPLLGKEEMELNRSKAALGVVLELGPLGVENPTIMPVIDRGGKRDVGELEKPLKGGV